MNNIDHALKFIKRVPTGDNAQPWEVQIEDNKVYFYYNYQRGVHPYNRAHSADKICISFLKRYIEMASHIMSFNYTFEELGHLNYLLTFKTEPNLFDYSEHPFFLRRTDRRYFDQSVALEENQRKKIHAGKLIRYEDFPLDLKDFFKKSEQTFWSTADVLKYFFKWIHFSKKSYNRKKDGIYYKEVHMAVHDIPVIFLLKFIPRFAAILFKTPLFFFVNYKIKRFYKDSTFLFYYLSPDQKDLEDICIKILNDWCYLQSQGYSYQPMNLLNLPLFDDFINYKLKKKEASLFKLQKLQSLLGTEKLIIWSARIGHVQEKYPHSPSPRR